VIIDGEKLENAKFDSRKSVVQQLSGHPDVFELAELSICYENIRAYRDWSFGRNQSIRLPQSASQKNDFLNEDYRNLGLILNKIKFDLPTKRKIIEELQRFVPTATGFDTLVQAGTIQIYLEEGEFSTPAIRLSDGTLRYLTLLTILCDPKPPGLVCIEEPELGLHPDIIPEIARLIQEASKRCQLIITTHSQTLVDAFSEQPEAIVVCEHGEDGTKMGRLPPELLKEWLQTYSLGELWSRGHLGGNRW
jgi:predicted ATPase